MKKIFVLLVIFIIANLGQGCKPEHYLIKDIDFNAAFIGRDGRYNYTSTIKDKLIFIISYKWELVSAYIPNLGNVCYAYTPARFDDNQLLRNTFSITFDKAFIYQGNTIPDRTNIFEIKAITKEITEYENENYLRGEKNIDLVLDFSDKFFKNSVFDTTEEYTVTFSCETSDDKFFEKTITIKFEK